jgi:YegS/Rv2252/BmrU family lipid kinase
LKQIHFIVNPIAGSGKGTLEFDYLNSFFDSANYKIIIKKSNFKRHAVELAKDSLNEHADIIVACGGDGTINEVASSLVNTSTPLGIIPIGSGNGLASNLNIPKDIEKAIQKIITNNQIKIDVGVFNNQYFFSNCGIGFDASVVKNYENSERRMLSSYIFSTFKSVKEINYNDSLDVVVNETSFNLKPFMLFVSNSNQMGYNFSLTPKASLTDGLLDVLVISKMSKLKLCLLGVLILFKKQHLLSEVQSIQTKSLSIYSKTKHYFEAQIDGELHLINNNSISISILDKNLNVII